MSTTRDFDRTASAWLADGPSELNDRVLDAALREIHDTQQRRRWPAPWRFSSMPMLTRATASAAVLLVALVGVGGALYMSSNSGGPGGTPVPTPPASPTPPSSSSAAPTIASSPSQGPVSFTSPLFGYTLTSPAGWSVTPSTIPWPAGADPNFDRFAAPVSQSPDFDDVYVAAQPVPDGMTAAEWLLAYAERVAASGRDCKGPVDAWTDENAARLAARLALDVGSVAIRRLDLECQGAPGQTLNLADVALVVDGTGYVMTGNPTVIAQFLDSFRPGS